MTDHYEALGEFHDLFMDETWERLRPSLTAAFAGLSPSDLILDLGAGTGLGTRTLAGCTGAQIIAIEPSLTMRAVLTARVADDPDLASSVTVVAGRVPEALDAVPRPIAGFVCAHMLGHLTSADRAETFRRLADLLIPDGRGVVSVHAGDSADDSELRQERMIGSYTYVARYLPTDDPRHYTNDYTVLDGERVVRHHRFAGTWEPVSLTQLNSELAPAFLRAELIVPGLALVSRS